VARLHDYTIDVPATGNYTFAFAVGTADAASAIDLALDGTGASAAKANLPSTGGYGTIKLATVKGLPLTKGAHLVRLTFTGGFNVDYFRFTKE
jgi:Carbohydrate binding module (family 6)